MKCRYLVFLILNRPLHMRFFGYKPSIPLNLKWLLSHHPKVRPLRCETPRTALHCGQKYRLRLPRSPFKTRNQTVSISFLQCGHIGRTSSFCAKIIIVLHPFANPYHLYQAIRGIFMVPLLYPGNWAQQRIIYCIAINYKNGGGNAIFAGCRCPLGSDSY